MKRTKRYMGFAALAVAGAMMMGCNGLMEEIPGQAGNDVTLTTTVSLDAGTLTKALSAAGVKTFAVGEQIAVVYENTGSEIVKAVSEELSAGDIFGTGDNLNKTATFTVTLTAPKAGGSVKLIYPAAMAKADCSINYDVLATQDGTLATLSSNLDFAMYEGSMTASAGLPASPTLTNQLAILALTLKTSDGSSDITGSITSMNITDGTYSYAVNRSAAAGPIYVAIRPTDSANINITATTGSNVYTKSLTSKTYAIGNGYNLILRMIQQAGAIGGFFTVNPEGKTVYFSQGNLQATTSDLGSTWTWSFAANQWDYIGGKSGGVGTNTGNNFINGNGTVSDNGTIDLFGWVGANSSFSGAAAYGICNSSTNSDYGNTKGEALKSDWGTLAISNGGNMVNSGWYTPTIAEWQYVFSRTSNSTVNDIPNACFAQGTINTDNGNGGMKGMILFPDGVTITADEATSWGSINDKTSWAAGTNCTTAQWTALAAKGCIFLPAAGYRVAAMVYDAGNSGEYSGLYWSSTYHAAWSAYSVVFVNLNMSSAEYAGRCNGYSVRLVREVE